MGKVKAWMMDREEKFSDKISEIIGECETWHEFSSRMENHMHMMDHVPLTECPSSRSAEHDPSGACLL